MNVDELIDNTIIDNDRGVITAESMREVLHAINDQSSDYASKMRKYEMTASGSITLACDTHYIIKANGNIDVFLGNIPDDQNAHHYEMLLVVGSSAPTVSFPSSIKWAKNLEIGSNANYLIVIEDNIGVFVRIAN